MGRPKGSKNKVRLKLDGTPAKRTGPKKGSPKGSSPPYDPTAKENPNNPGKDEWGRYLPKNDFWKARSRHGRKPIWPCAQELREACFDYVQWVNDNPLYECKVFHTSGEITKAVVPKMRAMTQSGLCIFLGISRDTWKSYQSHENTDFSLLAREMDEIIYTQKFEGASAEFLNANIIARDLGLADKKEHTGKDGGPIETKGEMTLDEASRLYLDNLK